MSSTPSTRIRKGSFAELLCEQWVMQKTEDAAFYKGLSGPETFLFRRLTAGLLVGVTTRKTTNRFR